MGESERTGRYSTEEICSNKSKHSLDGLIAAFLFLLIFCMFYEHRRWTCLHEQHGLGKLFSFDFCHCGRRGAVSSSFSVPLYFSCFPKLHYI